MLFENPNPQTPPYGQRMLFEAHGHLMANAVTYASAAETHGSEPNVDAIRSALQTLCDYNVTFFRDGGDKFGVSRLAKSIAPEYGIDYRTPLYVLHRQGFYGHMYGHGYSDITEARAMVAVAKNDGADFIKIALSGMLDFDGDGGILGDALPHNEVAPIVDAARTCGLAVMAHCNGADNIKNALTSGVMSIEHGFYADDECIELFVKTGAVWVPTCVTVANNLDGSRFPKATMQAILDQHTATLKRAAARGVLIATGSDSGAFNVLHGRGTLDETELLTSLGIDFRAGNARIAELF